MRKLMARAAILICLFAIAALTMGCVERPTTPLMYTPKLTIFIHNGKLMVYVRASMGELILYKRIWIKINNSVVFNESNIPEAFVSQNLSYGIINLTVYVKYVEDNGHLHVYEKTYTLKITKEGIIVNKIFYGKEYTKFLPEVKTNAWRI